jgi:hypothetical protein
MGNLFDNIKCDCLDINQNNENELNMNENNESKKKINKKTILKKADDLKEKID